MNPSFVGRNLIRLDSVDSTNNFAASLLKSAKTDEGTAILARYQESGKGQRGAGWQSKPGQNLLSSFIFYPNFLEARHQFDLSRVAALACHNALCKFGLSDVSIKWPNDLFVRNLKIGGILIENELKGSRIDVTIIGIGININQQELGGLPATSLFVEKGILHQIDTVFQTLCMELEEQYQRLRAGQTEAIRQDYEALLFGRDQSHRYLIDGKERICYVRSSTPEGGLTLECEGELLGPFSPREIKLQA